MVLLSQWRVVSIHEVLNALYLLQAMNALCTRGLPNEKSATPHSRSGGPGLHSLLICNRKSNRSFHSHQTHAELPCWFILFCLLGYKIISLWKQCSLLYNCLIYIQWLHLVKRYEPKLQQNSKIMNYLFRMHFLPLPWKASLLLGQEILLQNSRFKAFLQPIIRVIKLFTVKKTVNIFSNNFNNSEVVQFLQRELWVSWHLSATKNFQYFFHWSLCQWCCWAKVIVDIH